MLALHGQLLYFFHLRKQILACLILHYSVFSALQPNPILMDAAPDPSAPQSSSQMSRECLIPGPTHPASGRQCGHGALRGAWGRGLRRHRGTEVESCRGQCGGFGGRWKSQRWCGCCRRCCARVWTTQLRSHSAFHCPLSTGEGGRHWSGTVCPTAAPSAFLLTNRTPMCSDHLVSCPRPPSQTWRCHCSRPQRFRKGCLRPLGKGAGGFGAAHSSAHSEDGECLFSLKMCCVWGGNVGNRGPPWGVPARQAG